MAIERVRADLQALDAPLIYVGPRGCSASRDRRGAVTVVGPWDAIGRRMFHRARALLAEVPQLPRTIVAHWYIAGQSEHHLAVISTPAGYVLVRGDADLTIDDVSGFAVPGHLRVSVQADHGDDLDALGEHFARLRCALGHIAQHAP